MEYPEGRLSRSWPTPLAEATSNDTRVFLVMYQLDVNGSSSWEQVLGQGYALIVALDASCVNFEKGRIPESSAKVEGLVH